jgi:hypothetical protein
MDGIARLAQRPAHGSTGRVGPTDGDGQQGMRRLRIMAEAHRLLVTRRSVYATEMHSSTLAQLEVPPGHR